MNNRFSFGFAPEPLDCSDEPQNPDLYIHNCPHPFRIVSNYANDMEVRFFTPMGEYVFVGKGEHATLVNLATGRTKNFRHWHDQQVAKHLRELWGATGTHNAAAPAQKQKGILSRLFKK